MITEPDSYNATEVAQTNALWSKIDKNQKSLNLLEERSEEKKLGKPIAAKRDSVIPPIKRDSGITKIYDRSQTYGRVV